MRRLLLLIPAALMLAACGGGGSSESKGGTVVQTIKISEKEFSLNPSTVNVSKTGTYEFEVSNDGRLTHALEIEGNGVEEKSGDIDPGAKMTLRVTFSQDGSYEMYCPIDGHKAQGMSGSVVVGGTAGGGGETTTAPTTTSAPGY
jgi:PQQ system protein